MQSVVEGSLVAEVAEAKLSVYNLPITPVRHAPRLDHTLLTCSHTTYTAHTEAELSVNNLPITPVRHALQLDHTSLTCSHTTYTAHTEAELSVINLPITPVQHTPRLDHSLQPQHDKTQHDISMKLKLTEHN